MQTRVKYNLYGNILEEGLHIAYIFTKQVILSTVSNLLVWIQMTPVKMVHSVEPPSENTSSGIYCI